MNIQCRFRLSLLMLFFLNSISGVAVAQEIQIAKGGRTEISVAAGSSEMAFFEIITTPVAPTAQKDSDAFVQSIGVLFGRDHEADTVISGIKVKWEIARVHVERIYNRRSVFSDGCNCEIERWQCLVGCTWW